MQSIYIEFVKHLQTIKKNILRLILYENRIIIY